MYMHIIYIINVYDMVQYMIKVFLDTKVVNIIVYMVHVFVNHNNLIHAHLLVVFVMIFFLNNLILLHVYVKQNSMSQIIHHVL